MAFFECTIGGASGDGVALIVQCDANFAGSTITADNGEDVFSEICPSASPYTVRFEGIPTGTYTISGVSQGQTFTTQFTVLDYETTLNATPEGATVLPINDIQIWLHCANIWDKTYTTLDEVLADNTTLLALISSNNAVDYMVRSTDWAGARNLIPKMTSNTTPSGKVTYSSLYTGASVQGYYAFDGIINTSTNYANAWASQTNSNEWIKYEFASAVKMDTAKVYNGNRKFIYKLQGSNDDTTWTDLTSLYTEETYSFTVNNFTLDHSDTPFKYLRYYLDSSSNGAILLELEVFSKSGVANNQTAMGYIGNNDYAADTLLADATWCEAICNSDYFESVLNVKVPTMTSNTTPSGVVSASTIYDSGYPEWRAFDGTIQPSSTGTNGWLASVSTAGQWIQYQFPTAIAVKKYNLYSKGVVGSVTSLQGSNDGSNWTQISDSALSVDIDTLGVKNIINNTKYKYYRAIVGETNINRAYGYKLQFYGRA